MAVIVGGIASSHGPLLSTPPELWHLRAGADRTASSHWYDGARYDYDSLAAARTPGFADRLDPAEQQRSYDSCQASLDRLAERFKAMRADLVVMVGNDQREVFKEDFTPALAVYTGPVIENIPLGGAQLARLPPGIRETQVANCPPEGATYEGLPAQAAALATHLMDEDFDVATVTQLPKGDDRQHGIPHAFGFIYRRILSDRPPPSIPIFINVGVAPNRVRPVRALAFGRALARAIQALPGDARVVVIASGGMSHYVVDEVLDRKFLGALKPWNEATIAGIPDAMYESNTAEMKSWLVGASALDEAGLTPDMIEYATCYRTEAGTGSGMGFVSWS